jgi:hypothetical protein
LLHSLVHVLFAFVFFGFFWVPSSSFSSFFMCLV